MQLGCNSDTIFKRSKIRSTDQKFDQQIKSLINRSKGGSTDKKFNQQIKRSKDGSTDQK